MPCRSTLSGLGCRCESCCLRFRACFKTLKAALLQAFSVDSSLVAVPLRLPGEAQRSLFVMRLADGVSQTLPVALPCSQLHFGCRQGRPVLAWVSDTSIHAAPSLHGFASLDSVGCAVLFLSCWLSEVRAPQWAPRCD